jgi:hypothetical protein
MHCLLIGNGINRLALQGGWNQLLKELACDIGGDALIPTLESAPLSLFFEQLCALRQHDHGAVEREMKLRFATRLGNIQPVPLHHAFINAFDVILTTNYDHTLESALDGHLYEHASAFRESRYSLFRRVRIGLKEVWHIHGDVDHPDSMVLGYDHYAGYLQKIRNYLTAGIDIQQGRSRIRSPLKGGLVEFEDEGAPYSWVDHFLRDHLHIVGLGLDFTEMDLWWLLLHKRRRKNRTGHTFVYRVMVQPPTETSQRIGAVLSSFGIFVADIPSRSYELGYLDVLARVQENIQSHPELLPSAAPNLTISEPNVRDDNSRRQLKLRLPAGRKGDVTKRPSGKPDRTN